MLDSTKVVIKRRAHTQRQPITRIKQKAVTHLADRFIKRRLESLEDYEIVELLLSLASPNMNHKKRAKDFIRQFGSLRGVIEASPEELQQGGITPSGILCIRLISEIPVRVLKQRIINKPVYREAEAVFDYLCYSMRGLKNEVFKVIYLNSRNQIIETSDLFEGTIDKIPVSPREIIEDIIRYRAVCTIFAHNHPSGDPMPSKSDKQITRDLVFIGSALQIKVLDHIVIGNNSYFSFADKGLIKKYENDFLTLRMKACD